MDEHWYDRAACLGTSIDIWYRFPGKRPDEVALRICQTCPVIHECLNDALKLDDINHGFRAGMTPKERRITRDRRRARAEKATHM